MSVNGLKFDYVLPEVNQLRVLREKKYLTQLDIADELGIHQPSVSQFELSRDCSVGRLRRYAEAIGYDVIITFKERDVQDQET